MDELFDFAAAASERLMLPALFKAGAFRTLAPTFLLQNEVSTDGASARQGVHVPRNAASRQRISPSDPANRRR